MKNIPYILIKSAMTLDGYIDDTSDKRLIISNEKDFAEVEKVRESCDAILVGAETIRKDNPRLTLKSEKKLIKVTITSSGNIDPKSNFFTVGKSEKIMYTTTAGFEKLRKEIFTATIIELGETIDLRNILKDLHERGVKRLLVEGGSTIISQFLKEELFDELQISIAPYILGEENAPRFIKKGLLQTPIPLQLMSTKNLDDIIVLTYMSFPRRRKSSLDARQHEHDKKWMQYVIELSKKCPPSDTSFAVGAALVDNNGNLVADGYSRELNPKMHAEETVFEKIKKSTLDLSNMTLYTSLEPCSTRKSKTDSCVDLILKYGINHIVYAATEPLFFTDANGAKRLEQAGKNVTKHSEYEQEVINQQSPTIYHEWKTQGF